MTYKENVAIYKLLELLEARYAMRILWALRDGRPQTFRLLQDSSGQASPNTLNTRCKELQAHGLISRNSDGYIITPDGSKLLHHLSEMASFAKPWLKKQDDPLTRGKRTPKTPAEPRESEEETLAITTEETQTTAEEKTVKTRKPRGKKEVKEIKELVVEDLTIGDGAIATVGYYASILYSAWVYENGKKGALFFETTEGNEPYKFLVGEEEAIDGLDMGIQGMKVGGKRRLLIPEHLAFGDEGSPCGCVPPNKAMIFEVELVRVRRKKKSASL